MDSLSLSVETAVASASVRGVKALVSEFVRIGGSSDFYVYSVVFGS